MLICAETAIPIWQFLHFSLLWKTLSWYSHFCFYVSQNQKPDSSHSSQIPVYTIGYSNTPSLVLSRNCCLLKISSPEISLKVSPRLNFEYVDFSDDAYLS